MKQLRLSLVLTILILIGAACGSPSGAPAGPTAAEAVAVLRFADLYPGDASTVTRIVVASINGQRYVVEGKALNAFLDLLTSLTFSRLPVQVEPHLPYQYRVDLYQGQEAVLQMDVQGAMAAVHAVYYGLDADVEGALDGLVRDAPQLVTYYRLRLELSTTAAAARVTAQDTRYLLTARPMGTSGDPTRQGVAVNSLWVGQEQAGSTVTITADYVVTTPGLLFQPVPCLFEQKGEGVSMLRVYNVAGVQPELLQEVSHEGTAPLDFALDLTALAGRPSLEGQLPPAPSRPMLWAYYYPWYIENEWDTFILQDRPELGYYGSASRAVIGRHVEQAQGAGIDGFISSWWGPGSFTDENLKTLLDVAQERNLQVMINLELLGDDGQPRSGTEILAWLRYAASAYGDHPAYTRVDGRPVFVVWASQTVANEVWEMILAMLRAEGLEPFLLGQLDGEWARLDDLDIFRGLYQYNILNVVQSNDQAATKLAEVNQLTGRAVRYYPLLLDAAAPRLWAATVQPGYDDHLIDGRTAPVLDRDDGALYRATWQAALSSDPDWIFITTWNEWWEHTYIEPGKLYGDRYLDITREFAELWKSEISRRTGWAMQPKPATGMLPRGYAARLTSPPECATLGTRVTL